MKTIRLLIITRTDNELKVLKQLPSNIVYGSEVVDVGYLENGPHYLNNISYEEVDKPIEEIEGE